jgi:hypothetical protein
MRNCCARTLPFPPRQAKAILFSPRANPRVLQTIGCGGASSVSDEIVARDLRRPKWDLAGNAEDGLFCGICTVGDFADRVRILAEHHENDMIGVLLGAEA